MTRTTLNYDRLLKLRLIVARFGEMDLAKWWNTRGQLGRLGTAAVRRGFPRTHYFAQARSVFAVAAHRCREVFNPPESVTLWQLPETVEEEFASHWERWMDRRWPSDAEAAAGRPRPRAATLGHAAVRAQELLRVNHFRYPHARARREPIPDRGFIFWFQQRDRVDGAAVGRRWPSRLCRRRCRRATPSPPLAAGASAPP